MELRKKELENHSSSAAIKLSGSLHTVKTWDIEYISPQQIYSVA